MPLSGAESKYVTFSSSAGTNLLVTLSKTMPSLMSDKSISIGSLALPAFSAVILTSIVSPTFPYSGQLLNVIFASAANADGKSPGKNIHIKNSAAVLMIFISGILSLFYTATLKSKVCNLFF